MKKIAVFVSGGGTNLGALIKAQDCGKIKSGRITLVVSSSEKAYAVKRAENAGIDVAIVNRRDYSDRDAFSKALDEAVSEKEIDLIVLAGFMYVLPQSFCKKYANRIINVHPALIPSFCGDGYYGLHVHEKALEYGVKVTGATVHFVNEVTDGGAIILQKAVEISENDTPETLQKKVMENCEWQLLPEAVELFCGDRLEISGRRVIIK